MCVYMVFALIIMFMKITHTPRVWSHDVDNDVSGTQVKNLAN